MTLLFSGVGARLRAGRGRQRAGHLHDRRLLALLDGAGRTADRKHLEVCPDCANRLAGLRAFLDGLRNEAEAACDEAISPAHLAARRMRIRRRVKRAAGCDGPRVLRFPGAARPRPVASSRSRWWLGAAAAAGLVIGLTVGRFDARLDVSGADTPPGDAAAGVATAGVAEERPADPGSHAGDEQFMQELELALTSPRIPALVALDELTPRLQEIAVDVR
jgi:hypothetical protein